MTFCRGHDSSGFEMPKGMEDSEKEKQSIPESWVFIIVSLSNGIFPAIKECKEALQLR